MSQAASTSNDPHRLPLHADGVNLTLAELVEYQRQSVRWLPPAKSVWSELNGQHLSRRRGRGMDFSEVRPYQAGDDIRSIDWRVTARTGQTHTKLFSEEREQPVMLAIDLSPSMKFGSQLLLKSVQACHFAALISWLSIKTQDRVGALILTQAGLQETKPTARHQGALNIIHQLVKTHQQLLTQPQTQPMNQANWQAMLRHLHYLCPKGSEIVIISDFYHLAANDKQRLSQLRQHNSIKFVQLFDPLEQGQTAFRGSVQVTDHKQSAWLNFAAAKTRQRLAEQYQTHQQLIQDLARSLAIPLHTINAGLSLASQLTASNAKSS